MEYKISFLDVDDADAIVIKYKLGTDSRWVTAVVDAGNEGDGEAIKSQLEKDGNGIFWIDHAFCTHPDKDHKGGFFDLLGDSSVQIRELCVFDPRQYLNQNDFVRIKSLPDMLKRAIAPFQSVSDSRKNLINIAEARGILRQVQAGTSFEDIPLLVLGPASDYYRECVVGMVQDFAELRDDPDFEPYDENAEIGERDAKSIIDQVEDESCTNKASMVLLFQPAPGKKFLLTGDAASSSLQEICDYYAQELNHCILKVPHHGSKHNLTTAIIDTLRPSSAVISAAGTQKHPNSAIVYWLSKYCNVYSTHKSKTLTYSSSSSRNPATPLKYKMN